MIKDNRYCLICKPRNRTIYWHKDKETGEIWCFCNKCDRGYSLPQYCQMADVNIEDFLKGDFYLEESRPNEVQAMIWPSSFIPLSDPRASSGVEYVKDRGLTLDGDMYYDIDEEGIVFPYYFENHYCGAQIRFLKTRTTADGELWKVTTVPGTRLGLLFYGWNQGKFLANVKGIIVTEGAFNAISINQAFTDAYGSIASSPWRAIACSGSSVTEHHQTVLQELVGKGYKVIVAPDSDEAGLKMYHKFLKAKCSTHYAFTGEPKDWNDKIKELGAREFARFFLSRIKTMNEEIGKR